MLLTARGLSKTFGPRKLFSGITLGLLEGQRVGLIGANGSGKSTLLKIFAGREEPDEGVVEAKRGLVVGYVAQEDVFEPGKTALQIVQAAVSEAVHDEHDREIRAQILLDKAGFGDAAHPYDILADRLSGGWRKRLAVVRELAKEPDLLLMDEPTNHLDLEGIEWLEDVVDEGTSGGGKGGGKGGGDFGTLSVSHDRRFLEETCTRVIELSSRYPDGYLSCEGAYSDFVEKREAFFAAQEARQTAVASAVRREIQWLRRGAKARTTKAKGRIQRAGEMMEELADLKRRNTEAGAAEVDFAGSGRQSKKLIELKNVGVKVRDEVGAERWLFRGISDVISPRVRLGLIGANGSGKSTLIRVMTGLQLARDKAEAKDRPSTLEVEGSVLRADGLKVVVFDQRREQLDLSQTLRRALSPNGDSLIVNGQPMHVTGWARKFLFRTEQLDLPVSDLSGGERARVLIARLMMTPADVLVLDEPTNDLDIATLDVLEESLEGFDGAVVLVTHDRYLMDRLCNDIWALDGLGNWARYGELEQWERARAKAKEDAQRQAKAAAEQVRKEQAKAADVQQPAASAKKVKLSWKEQKELEGMEAAIAAAEAEHQTWQAACQDPKVMADHVKSREAYAKAAEAQTRVETLYARWAELEAKTTSAGV